MWNVDELKVLARRFWWLRGAAAAMTLTALAPQVSDLSRYKFLRGLHAIIIGWHSITKNIGIYIGKIPLVPEISAEACSTFIFFSSVILPYVISIIKDMRDLYFVNVASRTLAITMITAQSISGCILTYMYYVILYYGPMSKRYITLIVFFSIVLLFLASLSLPYFRKGIVFFIAFFITIELLYFVNAPWFTEAIDRFACEEISEGCPKG